MGTVPVIIRLVICRGFNSMLTKGCSVTQRRKNKCSFSVEKSSSCCSEIFFFKVDSLFILRLFSAQSPIS